MAKDTEKDQYYARFGTNYGGPIDSMAARAKTKIKKVGKNKGKSAKSNKGRKR